ncbi:MAG: thiamine pyrophosphate-dependent dehydrogenase E1 component subunit alpha [Candidatus Omnitrophota bacterium]|nr:MAG: thiamine pyrophosphate-dependent dehydrogenase E1 component subunit alpha [Candidatus Omnitrophota bacterium]
MKNQDFLIKILDNNKILNLEFYKKLFLIRRSEEKIIELYPENEMRMPMHMSMGGEAIAVGVCHALGIKGQVFGSYRSHAIYLAKTQDTNNFFAEIYGKTTSSLKGKCGSMHLCAPDFGFMGASAIVASIIPVACGTAFANKRKNNGKIVSVFFGDGAVDEGNFWESLNVASLMKLPILFVCEDNALAVHTPRHQRQGYDSIVSIVSKFNCNVLEESTTDTEVIYRKTCQAIELIRTTQMPCFLYLRYYRYLEHVGTKEDFDAGYRSKEEFEKWHKKDPVNLQRKKLLRFGIEEEQIRKLEVEIEGRIENSIRLAQKAPFTEISELHRDVFYEENKKD